MLHKIPSMSTILEHLSAAFPQIEADVLKEFARKEIDKLRQNPKKYGLDKKEKDVFESQFISKLRDRFKHIISGSLQPVINATGIVLHTNLGRAPLNQETVQKIKNAARYTNLELNLDSGRRGQRNDHLSVLLQLLSGAEAGFAVNNNAAAVMLMLNSVGYRKEVILSRGEMIEIGGSFRLPEVMKMSGCKLKEIGTTNKTHLKDYEEAISTKTGAILICHSSNYEVQGFTAKPELDELVDLAAKYEIPLIYDLGSGLFKQLPWGKAYPEPLVSEIVATGVDLVSFSGDKLLGGPQAGLIVGKQKWIDKCTKNHLLRALRLDKVVISILQDTLINHLHSDNRLDAVIALNQTKEQLEQLSASFIQQFPEKLAGHFKVVDSVGQVGSGTYPTFKLPSCAIQVNKNNMSASKLSSAFRKNTPPVLGYINDDIFHLDLRAVNEDEINTLVRIVTRVLS